MRPRILRSKNRSRRQKPRNEAYGVILSRFHHGFTVACSQEPTHKACPLEQVRSSFLAVGGILDLGSSATQIRLLSSGSTCNIVLSAKLLGYVPRYIFACTSFIVTPADVRAWPDGLNERC